MKQIFGALFFVVVTSTSFSNGPCITCIDTIPNDSEIIIKAYKEAAAPLIDSIRRDLAAEIDETKHKQDSLALVVDSIYQETFKKEVTLLIDKWVDQKGKAVRYFWKYFLYPNGDTLFSRTIPKMPK
jgi:hypothetical protein